MCQWIRDKWGRLGIGKWLRVIWRDVSTSSSTPPVAVQYWLSNGQTNRCVHVHNIDAASSVVKMADLPYVSNYGWMRHTALSINLANKWWNNKMWRFLWMLLCYILQAVITVLVAETNWCCQGCLVMVRHWTYCSTWCHKIWIFLFQIVYYSNGAAWKIIDWWLKCLLIFFIANNKTCWVLSCFSIFPLVKQCYWCKL
jgi:hypothetical protein